MTGIRVTYSGLISFAVGLISLITGLIFTLIVTRRLSPEEFGTWGLIGGILVYPLIIQPVIGYWSTREIARGESTGKTSILTSGYFSLVSMLIYFLIICVISIETDASFDILLMAILLVPSLFINQTLTAINLGWKPHAVSFALVGFESIKIPIGFLLIYFLDLGIMGAIITTLVAQISSSIILAWYAKEKLTGKIQISYVKKWIKLSWIPLYGSTQNMILSLDVIIFTIITGSVIGISFWSAAITVANIVGHSGSVSQALYSKLVEGGKEKHLEENLITVLYFAIPLCSLSIVFAKPGVFTLNPLYVEAFPIVIFMSLKTLLVVIRGILDATLSGLEKVDANKESTVKNYLNSKLFFLPTIKNIHHGIYIISLIVVLWILSQNNIEDLDLVIYWSIIALIIQIPFTAYSYYLLKKNISFNISIFKVNITKYLIVSVGVFSISYFLIENFIVYEIEILKFLPNILLLVGFSTISYIVITYFIDSRTKKLIKSIFAELLH
jgi:O-antigen/teichoic acid export membrane protein